MTLQKELEKIEPGYDWSVKNQARMHLRNGDAAYNSIVDAMGHWPETATAVAARLTDENRFDIIAPFGLEHLFKGRLVPTKKFIKKKRKIFDQRIHQKNWLTRWPKLKICDQ